MLTRNLLYTAISRAKKQLVLVGRPEMLDFAVRNFPKRRNSSLVQKTLQIMKSRKYVA